MELYEDVPPDELERMSGEARRKVLAAFIYASDDPGTELAALRNAAAYLATEWETLRDGRDQATAKLMIRVCELLVSRLCAASIEDAAEEMCRAQPVKRAAMLQLTFVAHSVDLYFEYRKKGGLHLELGPRAELLSRAPAEEPPPDESMDIAMLCQPAAAPSSIRACCSSFLPLSYTSRPEAKLLRHIRVCWQAA